ncbi:outer membrane protein [Parabacteroides sp. PFB2-10]|uniref:TolC family protein n=1 Tax=Parabacteroides sp. PFB2-10 TaxID=1742405 RepID=UPI002476B0DA|nr:TolC family protein [Parabacteroides sp. PFB2-10]MDH6312001.1 outer membrane protein [Parabacteroides sp. PFB2-10]
MKKILFTFILAVFLSSLLKAQERQWTMEACMQYAVEYSPAVKQKEYQEDTYKAEYASAIGNFFPSLEGSVGAEYNFGRGIDPETNMYTNTTSFYNSYRLNANMPLFSGGQLVNTWRLSKVNRQMGMNDIQKAKDDLALKVMVAFVDVVYYQGTKRYAGEKLEESKATLYKSERMNELGLKSKADLALVEAQVAEDDYNLTRQENLYNQAVANLKDLMNYPQQDVLAVDTTVATIDYLLPAESVADIYTQASEANPTALQAEYQVQAAKMNHLIQKGRFFPTISLYAGVNTTYFEQLNSDRETTPFKDQFKNNRGEWVGVSLSIPLFSRLNRLTDARRAKNNLRIAAEQQTEVLRQLQTAIEKAVLDREGYAKETFQMEKKQAADAIAYQQTLRKYEEGLMSPIDLQTSANVLLMSRANLLQRKLLYLLKCKEVDYYKGVPLIDN